MPESPLPAATASSAPAQTDNTDALATSLASMSVEAGSQNHSGTHTPMAPTLADDVFGDAAVTYVGGGYGGYLPRQDRVRAGPSSSNAQGLYPPSALLFVANLSSHRTTEQLEVSCQQIFTVFGPCFVKVRLDRNKHPFAFVQYENSDDAAAAVEGSLNLNIDGRRIRVERAKAERAVILSKMNGDIVTEEEARRMLERFGPIELMAPTQRMDHPRNNLQGAISLLTVIKGFPHHTSGFVLILAPPLEPRVRYNKTGSPIVRGFTTPRSAVDQKSIFVGNLPEGTTRQDLHTLFEDFGTIIQVNVIRKVFSDDAVNNFGFVEFSTVQEAEHASNIERTFKGVKLRVEPKEYSARRGPRTTYIPATPAHTSTPRDPYVDLGYLNAPRLNFAQPIFDPAVAMAQAQGFHLGEPNNPLHGFNPFAPGPFATPPHSNIERMGRMGLFSPTPSHHMNPFNPVIAPPGPQYAAQPFGTATFMNPIQEAEGEDY
ncbi:uncharacterized protein A1O9_05579 [Exophiala aquamarina CBS 119918]|uniref:RRM domain-containing protein n=1 Tax=Exophiala aquamarina CBS 119918 TaxID=1182545 RepID=A0A072PCU0_9EURO|nr:uncharacterized protein A1O9_05579 [Exophiala aquamarina CBS 119918]KEF57661.1 hypothetical protein A1O9_05579 [Exophiala aquamarina CBS 119918]